MFADARPAQPPREKELACGICSTVLCPHGRCRQCGECEACAGEAQPALEYNARKDGGPCASHRDRHAYLVSIGIREEDMEDAGRALDELYNDYCGGYRKRPFDSFCRECFSRLPAALKAGLHLHLKFGYLAHVREAWTILAGLRQDKNERKHDERIEKTK